VRGRGPRRGLGSFCAVNVPVRTHMELTWNSHETLA
jgi:hypothetical protein